MKTWIQDLADLRNAVGGTRFLMTIGAGFVDTLLLYVDKLDKESYVTLTLATVAAYITAHTFQRIKEGANGQPVSTDTR